MRRKKKDKVTVQIDLKNSEIVSNLLKALNKICTMTEDKDIIKVIQDVVEGAGVSD